MNSNAHDPADEEDLDVPEEFDDEHEAAACAQCQRRLMLTKR